MSTTATAAPEALKPLRTWSLLAGQRKQPTEYEIVSVGNIFRANEHDKCELSPNAQMNQWCRQYGTQSRLRHDDWNAFRDPDAITYRAYCTERDRDEVYVDRLLDQYAERRHDAGLSGAWVGQLAALYTPMRYLVHTAQMAAAYNVVMAPASTITNCLTFQMSDQLRWVSRVSYRTAELRKSWPDAGFGSGERQRWEKAPEWQRYRELMEKVLATYDWGESLFVLNLVAMPAIEVSLEQLKGDAERNGDGLTQFLMEAQLANSARRHRWMKRFMEFVAAMPGNVAFANDVVERWMPLARDAVAGFGDALGHGQGAAAVRALDAARAA